MIQILLCNSANVPADEDNEEPDVSLVNLDSDGIDGDDMESTDRFWLCQIYGPVCTPVCVSLKSYLNHFYFILDP